MRWNAVLCAALLALAAGASRAVETRGAPQPAMTPEEIKLVSQYTREINAIPEAMRGRMDQSTAFVLANQNQFSDAIGNEDFFQALAVLAGAGREKKEPPGGPPLTDRQQQERRERTREDSLRDLERRMPEASWLPAAVGEFAYKRGDYRAAYEAYARGLELSPRDVRILLGYGGSAYKLGDTALSGQAAAKALEVEPGNKDALALYHFSKDRAPTVRLPSAFGALADDRSAAAGAPAPQLSSTPDPAAAAARAQTAVQGSAVERSALFTKEAVNALRVRDYPVAYTQASRAIELNAQNAQALTYRAAALTYLHRYQDAVADASAALALAPGNASVLQTRSRAFSHEGRYQEGLKDAEETLLRDAANAYAYENKAFALAGLHDNAGAIEALRTAARFNPALAGRLERALQLPQDSDLTILFNESAAAAPAAAAVPSPGSRPKRFLRLAVLSGVGGLLIALGILHVVSASWREKVNMTVRRVLGPSAVEAAEAATPAPALGAFWTQYELVKEIGLGGMGVVYEALDRSLERRVAVKKMRDEIRLDPQDRQRFVREAKMVAQLHHPNIVDIYGIVEDGPEIYLVFEFVEGLTLQDALKSSGTMDLRQARRVLKEMAAAVEHAHEKGVIHRDLKPSNVMLSPDGRVKVMDFGVARQAKDALVKLSMTNTVVGTPPYMAPEQEQGTVRKESDVYALGICLYEMLTGTLPFAGSGAAMLLNKLNGKHVPPSQRVPSLSLELDKVMAMALAPDPDKRYKTPADLIAALEALPGV